MKKITVSIIVATFIILCFLPQAFTASSEKVYVIPVEDTVEKGLLAFLNRSIKEAETEKADLIVLDINTPGGYRRCCF
ncbi:hypothetical protein OC195_07515 [Priestia flexa]|nr:hypothetical protein OC195_07515 [Priestia flexa]